MIFNSIVVKNKKVVLPYITFSSPNSFTLGTNRSSKSWDGILQYSTNAKDWSDWNGSTLNSVNNKLYLRGINNTVIVGMQTSGGGSGGGGGGTTLPTNRWMLSGSNISCIGNIETLLDYQTVLNGEHPTMADYCYYCMFQYCTALTTAPELPATTLTNYCYQSMFGGCSALTTAPALPATALAAYCYNDMFSMCSALTTAPKLPATTLAISCYRNMFHECTSLITVPELPATTLAAFCYIDMFSKCSKIKLSTTKTGTYTQEYRIPTSGTGTTVSNSLLYMFTNTGGTFTGTPEINTTYYLDSSNTIV